MGKEEICNIKYSQILNFNYSNSGFKDSNRCKCKILY